MLGKLFPDPFLKYQDWAYLWIIFFISCKIEDHHNILKLNCGPLAITSYKGIELVSLPHFGQDIRRKLFLSLYYITWPNFIVCLHLIHEILCTMCIIIVCWPSHDVINFEINVISLIKSFTCRTKKSRQKYKYLENKKSFSNEIKSIFYNF